MMNHYGTAPLTGEQQRGDGVVSNYSLLSQTCEREQHTDGPGLETGKLGLVNWSEMLVDL